MSAFADILESLESPGGAAAESPADRRLASRRFESSVHAFERALGGLVPPVGAYRVSDAGAAPAQKRFASYATRVTLPAPTPAARATYA